MSTAVDYLVFIAGLISLISVLVGISFLLDSALREGERDGILRRGPY